MTVSANAVSMYWNVDDFVSVQSLKETYTNKGGTQELAAVSANTVPIY